MRKTKKALASLAIAGMTLSMVPFNVLAASPVPTRIAGNTAEETAAQIADQTGYTGAAILASSTSYGMVDALTAGPLAASLKAPILLTGAGNTLDAATKAELTKLAVKTVYVTSGTAVIKQGVIDELKGMGIEVVSLGGYDRAETSVNIAKKMTGVTKVAVANGIPDALSIASIAAAANEPILLTNRDALPSSVAGYLASTSITASDVIGGTGVISDAVKAALPGTTRHAGLTAYDTNNQVIQDFASSLAFDNVYVANGVTGIDALAGAPLAAQSQSAIVLTDGKTVPAVAAFTYSKAAAGSVVTALGGEAVVPESIRAGVAAGQVSEVPGDKELAIVSVSALDDSNRYLEITFSKPVTGLQPSDISLRNADTLARYGIKEVQMSSNGLTATVELYSRDDDDVVLAYQQDYIVTVNANGTILTTTFNRPYSFKIRVQDINVGDKEIVGYVDKGSAAGLKVTLDVPDSMDFDYEGVLGELVQVWYNGDNELVNYKILSTDAKEDSIEVTDVDEIKLLGEDEKYDISTEEYDNSSKDKFAFYVDGEKEDIADYVDKKFNFAKVGFDSAGDVEFVSAYSLKDVVLVDSVDGDEVVGVDGSGGFDAADATIVKDGKVIDVADLEKGDLLFYSDDADDEDGYAEVLNKKIAAGEIDEVYDDSIEVDGDTYNYIYDSDVFDYNNGRSIYINEDGDVDTVDSDAAESLQAAGDVTLYGDYAGNLIYIAGDTALVDGNTKVAVLTDDILGYKSARDKVEIDALTQDDDEVSYDMDLQDLDTITVDGTDYDIDNTSGANSDWNASLIGTVGAYTGIRLTDNSTTEPSVDISFSNEADAGSLVKLHLNDDGDLKELEFFSSPSGLVGVGAITASKTIEAGDKYIDGKKLTADTIMFDATEDKEATDAEDYTISAFGDYEGSEIDEGTYIYNDDAEVVAIWYDSTTSDDKSYDEAVVTKVLRNTDDEIVSLTVYAGGEEKTIKVDKVDADDVEKGDVVVLQYNEDNMNLVKGIARSGHDIDSNYTNRIANGSVSQSGVDVGNKKVTVGSTTYKLADNGLVLDISDPSDISEESLSDLRGESNVTVVLDAQTGLYAKFFLIGASTSTTPVTTTGAVTYEDTGNGVLYVDGTPYVLSTTTALKTSKGSVIAIGNTAIFAALAANDQVTNIVVTNGVVTSLVGTAVASVQTAADTMDTEIEALPAAASATLADQAAVNTAKGNYDVLTPAEKDFVKAANVTKLNDLVAKMATLQASADAAANQAAASAVDTEIEALPTVTSATIANQPAINTAKTNYDGLTSAQKALVVAANVTKLNDLLAKMDNLQGTTDVATDKAALALGFGGTDVANSVTVDLTLATTGASNTTITWASSNTALVATDGTVTRPNGADVQVTLTATIKSDLDNTVTDTKAFVVTVKGQ
ncbi:cell wall-binding protein [Desulfosporosinus orientis DSM 765]|uniref:Cell wall-binding protein n=1 Tax=Desulfosporosinus orientis (strain ATCC 19365 / DSM 765 / NCIMB 8382 / VKM B-1628 / Singapore I) TaxID=768706 RepID=G7WC71_DESOD|nr:cell wall-binding repeat-containing protein [Desulfosporosinus orientis]AET70689.1 cell wall-binding protein [Desulfosporosinus orientis DSM 765]